MSSAQISTQILKLLLFLVRHVGTLCGSIKFGMCHVFVVETVPDVTEGCNGMICERTGTSKRVCRTMVEYEM